MYCLPYTKTKTERYRINIPDAKKNFLPNDFVPGDNDVIVGRGKKCYEHVGNKMLRQLVKAKLKEYSASTCKYDKSNILADIADQVRMTGGTFVKEDLQAGKWYDVGDSLTRDKISQTFRDALHDKYRSSTHFKTNKRREDKIKASISHCNSNNFSQIENLGIQFRPQTIHQRPALDWRQNPLHYQNKTILDLELPSIASFSAEERLVSSSINLSFENNNPFQPKEEISQTCKVEIEDPFQPIPITKALNIGDDPFRSTISAGVNEIGNDCFEPIKLSEAEHLCLEHVQLCDEDKSDCLEPIQLSDKDISDISFKTMYDSDYSLRKHYDKGEQPLKRLLLSFSNHMTRST